MSSRILPFGWFPCGFNEVGRLGSLHEAGQALGLLNSGFRPKGHSSHNIPHFSSTRGLCSSSRGKTLCFGTLSMENCRLLMRIFSNASVTCDASMVHSMRLLKFHLYIYGDEPLKSVKLPMDFSSIT